MPVCPQSRNDWRAIKKKHNVPSGISKDDMGKLFQAYGDARGKSGSQLVLLQMQDAMKEHIALRKALKNYADAIKKKKDKNLDKFSKDCIEAWMGELDRLGEQAGKFANPVAKFSEALKNLETKIKPLAASPTAQDFKTFWSGPIRNLGTCLDGLVKMEPNCKKIQTIWSPLTQGGFSSVNDTPQDVLKRVKQVAVTLKAVRTEANKLNLTA